MFSSACPLSAYIGPSTIEDVRQSLERAGIKYDGPSALENWFNQHNALELVNKVPEDQKKAVRWYIDCGDDDFLYEGNSLIHIAMRKQGIPHEFRMRDGGHSWSYWRSALPEVLEFVSDSFHR